MIYHVLALGDVFEEVLDGTHTSNHFHINVGFVLGQKKSKIKRLISQWLI